MKNIELANKKLKELITDEFVYGQNVSAGSCIGGLTRGIEATNVQNSENTLVGFGFGMMLVGRKAIYVMKQFDFLPLAADHLVNTKTMIELLNPQGSFTIVCMVVDAGNEGPQSGFTKFKEFCELFEIQNTLVRSQEDIEKMELSKGFSIIGISQTFASGVIKENEK